jgi:hypothetical protein
VYSKKCQDWHYSYVLDSSVVNFQSLIRINLKKQITNHKQYPITNETNSKQKDSGICCSWFWSLIFGILNLFGPILRSGGAWVLGFAMKYTK